MEDNSKQCTKVTNASWEEIQKCWCVNCIHYADQEQICMHEEGPCCASCNFCYTEESFDDVFPACELHLHRINNPDYECCDQYNNEDQ